MGAVPQPDSKIRAKVAKVVGQLVSLISIIPAETANLRSMLRYLLLLSLFTTCLFAQKLPTPEQFAGFPMGADGKLVRWDKIVDYMHLAEKASPRIRLEEPGKTTNGHPYLVMTITSPETQKDIRKYQANQKRLAYPRGLEGTEADSLIASQKAVLLITLNIHSTEIGSTQMSLDLIHRLATEDSPLVKKILDNVIFLLVPSANPDGQIVVTDWFNKNAGTPFERSPLPELYHKYTGHDNNRDAFQNTQKESRLLNKLTYRDWLPAVVLDEHQMGNSGPRIFVPPFKNPINPNVDPVIWQLNGMLGYSMGTALHNKGYTGIINDAMYTSWWQGGFVMQVWWHNMVGLLTEVASVNVAAPVEQERAVAGRAAAGPEPTFEQMRDRDPRRPVPAPRDVTPTNTYPRPWMGGRWTLRNIVDYELTATWALLEAVADNRQMLNRNFYEMNRRGIQAGEKEAPYAFVIPARQHDPSAATKLLSIFDELGVEVHRATEAFQAGGKTYPEGSHVILMAQPFRAFAKDMLERQTYPAQRTGGPTGPVERPYDVTGWTLPLQMGVETVEVKQKFESRLATASPVQAPAGKMEAGTGNVVAYSINHANNNSFIAVNRLLKSGATVRWAADGGIVANSRENLSAPMKEFSEKLGLDVQALAALPASSRRLRAVRTGLYMPYTANMDEGWTRWLLEQYEFPYTTVRNKDLQDADLKSKFDVIILADQSKDSILKGATNEWVRPEYRGGISAEGVKALREFVRAGGTLITLGSASLVPVEEFPLPLKNVLQGLTPAQFSCPGSILKIFVDPTHPIAFGMKDQASAVFYNDVAFEAAPALGDAVVKTIARYPAGELLESGWIGGAEYLHNRIAAAEVTLGKGRVVLLGFSPQNRAQPHGTFKLLFNAIHLAGAE